MSDSTKGSSWISKLSKLFSDEPATRQDILELLKESTEYDLIDSDAYKMIEGVLQVSETRVREIMVPRSQMDFITETDSLEEILENVLESPHSRYPVLSEENMVVGVLLAKDVLRAVLKKELTEKSHLVALYRDVLIAPESKRLNILLTEFKSTRNHLAVVVDEYGETAGLATIEDVLEQIVGEIEDEHDIAEENIQKHITGGHSVDAFTMLDEFNVFFDTKLDDEQLETIGGLITKRLGHIPVEGETLVLDDLCFEVLKADGRRVESFLVKASQQPEAETSEREEMAAS